MYIFESSVQSEEEKVKIIKYAIDNKYVLAFWYKGVKLKDPKNKKYTKENWRRIEPTNLGTSAATGKLMLRGYQIDGATNTKNKAWKTFLVEEMSSIVAIDMESFYKPFQRPTGADFNANGDKKMGKIYSIIDLNKKPGDVRKPEPENNTEPEPELQTEPTDNKNNPENVKESLGFIKWLKEITNE